MSPSNLQGLNVIHPESPPSNLTDAQDLLSTPLFPDFATHDLDLWSNINFASDEPFVGARGRELKATEAEPRADSLTRKEAGHSSVAPTSSPASTVAPSQQPEFDFTRFLAEFGLSTNPEGVLLQNAAGVAQANFVAPPAASALPPATAPSTRNTSPSLASEPTAPAPKRARTGKAQTPAPTSAPSVSSSSSETPFPDPRPDLSTPVTPSEDKRRRNTAASARFRLKKKEREAALDARAQTLEDRVTSLERECEGLKRENGWLRGLVVGVTGGVVPAMNDAPIIAPPAASTGTAEKRKRVDEAD